MVLSWTFRGDSGERSAHAVPPHLDTVGFLSMVIQCTTYPSLDVMQRNNITVENFLEIPKSYLCISVLVSWTEERKRSLERHLAHQ
jgi:hypothetical protein